MKKLYQTQAMKTDHDLLQVIAIGRQINMGYLQLMLFFIAPAAICIQAPSKETHRNLKLGRRL